MQIGSKQNLPLALSNAANRCQNVAAMYSIKGFVACRLIAEQVATCIPPYRLDLSTVNPGIPGFLRSLKATGRPEPAACLDSDSCFARTYLQACLLIRLVMIDCHRRYA